ncbi:MAG: DUF3291 domain-containing protein [Bacteroidota bacterium]
MIERQLVTITFFHFKGLSNCFWALKMMQFAHKPLSEIEGLQFYKLMGSGGGNGFAWHPNFGVFAMLCCWDEPEYFHQFKEKSSILKAYEQRSEKRKTYYLNPASTQGTWSGQKPFKISEEKKTNGKLAILTRATIKTKELTYFWKKVPKISEQIKSSDGCEFSIGIGEWPVFQQATFSVWESQDAMKKFAYNHKLHAEAIKLTKERDWYSEEQFTRFNVFDSIDGFMST